MEELMDNVEVLEEASKVAEKVVENVEPNKLLDYGLYGIFGAGCIAIGYGAYKGTVKAYKLAKGKYEAYKNAKATNEQSEEKVVS